MARVPASRVDREHEIATGGRGGGRGGSPTLSPDGKYVARARRQLYRAKTSPCHVGDGHGRVPFIKWGVRRSGVVAHG
jgi:hypothetical protein